MHDAYSDTVFDRLVCDPSDAGEMGSPARDAMRTSIARDLEVLLNSRRPANLVPEGFPECSTCVLNFGVPEFDNFGNLGNPTEQQNLCNAFALAIEIFEPRLENVRVRLLSTREGDNLLRFQIEGSLAADGQIGIFEAGMKPHAGMVNVQPGGGA